MRHKSVPWERKSILDFLIEVCVFRPSFERQCLALRHFTWLILLQYVLNMLELFFIILLKALDA